MAFLIQSLLPSPMATSDTRDRWNQTPLHVNLNCFCYVDLDVVRYLVEKAHCDVSEYLLPLVLCGLY